VDAHHLFKGDRKEGERIPIPEVLGRDQGKLDQILQGTDIRGMNSGLLQPLAVKRGPLIGVIYRPLEPFELVGL
jgi:hypothetical protein